MPGAVRSFKLYRLRRQSPRSGGTRSTPEYCARAAEAPSSHSSWDAGRMNEEYFGGILGRES